MRTLTREEASMIKKKTNGKSSYARMVLLAMNFGEIILLEPRDWTQPSQVPSTYCQKLARKTGRGWRCEKTMDGSGWVIERTK